MTKRATLIIQVPRGSAVEAQLRASPPSATDGDEVAVETGPTDDAGNLEAGDVGEIVLELPSPETLSREPEEVRRVLSHAGHGTQPLVVDIEAASELRDEELTAVIEGARHTSRAVILRILRAG